MSQTIKLKKGFDLNIAGKAENRIKKIDQPELFAIKPMDFLGLSRPKLTVKEGENVKAGTPLFHERGDERVQYSSPVSGEIVEIKRGEKRKVLEIKILADKAVEFEPYKKYSVSDLTGISREEAQEALLRSGVWVNIIQRPYGIVANPDDTPKAIFISAFDTHPLAPDYEFVIKEEEQNFQAGINILKKFTAGVVHVNVDGNGNSSSIFNKVENAQINKIIGAHPAGNVGVQIHHIDPINKGEIVWTLNPVGVAQIGKFFLEGKHDASKLVALTGSQIKDKVYVKTYPGVQLSKLLAGNVEGKSNRFISGNVLTGEGVEEDGFLGYYSNQITVIPEGKYEEFLGWIIPTTKKLSFHKAFGMLTKKSKEYHVDTNTHGEHRNFVISGAFEKVMPMDILPTYLFKAILAEDFDEMEALGIYEVIEEDVALCEFIDVSKNPLQEILREGIDLIKAE